MGRRGPKAGTPSKQLTTSFQVTQDAYERYQRIPRGVCVKDRLHDLILTTEPDSWTPPAPTQAMGAALSPAARAKLDSLPDGAKAPFLRKCFNALLEELGV